MSSASKQYRILVIDGEIAAGKSTLCQKVVEHLNGKGIRAAAVLEPVDEWIRTGTLQRFYENPSMYIFEGQIYIMSTLVKAFEDARKRNPDADVFVLERSVETCRHVFYEIIKDDLVPGRREMFESFYTWLVEPTLVYNSHLTKHVYLKPSIEICQQRLRLRNRDAESSVSSDYQAKLRSKTVEYLTTLVDPSKLLVIDEDHETEIDYRDLANEGVSPLMERIEQFLMSQ